MFFTPERATQKLHFLHQGWQEVLEECNDAQRYTRGAGPGAAGRHSRCARLAIGQSQLTKHVWIDTIARQALIT